MKPKLGERRCQCVECGKYFGGVEGFDRHRVGRYEPPERRCLDTAEMQQAGFWEKDGIWHRPGSKSAHFERPPVAEGGEGTG